MAMSSRHDGARTEPAYRISNDVDRTAIVTLSPSWTASSGG